jgi:hypothetical protein
MGAATHFSPGAFGLNLTEAPDLRGGVLGSVVDKWDFRNRMVRG